MIKNQQSTIKHNKRGPLYDGIYHIQAIGLTISEKICCVFNTQEYVPPRVGPFMATEPLFVAFQQT